MNTILSTCVYLFLGWVLFASLGRIFLYIGFGFVMSALSAKDRKDAPPSPKIVVYIDLVIAFLVYLLDVAINILVDSFLMADFRPKYVFTTVSKRLSTYSLDPNEKAFRKWWARQHGFFLDAKDPSGDHIKS
jgi:hypothetical protein